MLLLKYISNYDHAEVSDVEKTDTVTFFAVNNIITTHGLFQ